MISFIKTFIFSSFASVNLKFVLMKIPLSKECSTLIFPLSPYNVFKAYKRTRINPLIWTRFPSWDVKSKNSTFASSFSSTDNSFNWLLTRAKRTGYFISCWCSVNTSSSVIPLLYLYFLSLMVTVIVSITLPLLLVYSVYHISFIISIFSTF